MKKSYRLISALLTFVMLLTLVPAGMVSAGAASKHATINVESVSASPGSTVEVNIEVKDNPGILGATLELSYGEGLTLTNAVQGEAWDSLVMTKPGKFSSPCKFAWDGQEISDSQIKDGIILTLTFEVSENASSSSELPVSLSYEYGDVADRNLDFVTLDINNGQVTVIDYTPGDVDGNGKVNALDVIYLRRYITGGYDVVINTLAANVNRDSKINTLDAIMIRRFITGGYFDSDNNPLILYPSPIAHTHDLIYVPAKSATDTAEGNIAYWYCSGCGKYFSDSAGKNEIKKDDIIIPIVVSDGIKITYHPYDGDTYLESIGVKNPNPNYYQSNTGLKLQNMKADGYIFDGWYDGEGANGELVKSIPAGSTDEFELYARWTPREYTITFNSPLVPVAPKKYQINTGATWTNPSLNGYNFIGWCDDNDKLVTNIPVGTTGNITLYANWTSKRNQTRPVSHLEDPLILEDADKGNIMFAYEIGTIENVPLQALSQTYQSIGGLKQTYTTQESVTVTKSEAKNVAKTVSNTTTDSRAWSLSEDWNNVTSVNEVYSTEKGWTKEEAEQYSKTNSNTYSLNSSSGGSQTQTSSAGLSGTLSKSNSGTIGGTQTQERETGSEYEVSKKTTTSSEMEAGIKLNFASAGGKISSAKEVNKSQKNYENNKTSESLNYSATGTDSKSVTGESSHADSGTSTWNTSSGYSSSSSTSQTQSVRNVLSEVVSETKGYGSSYSQGGSKSDTQAFTNTEAESNQYSSAITFSEGTVKTETKSIELGGENEGYYRFVLAGRAHVFAVVGYDVSTSSYYTFTYTVMDDETYTFIDYSKDTASFNDNENGVLPFEVPYFVKEYVDARLLQTEGLSVSQEGIVTSYNGTDDIVFIPSYYKMDNHDGTYTSIKVTGISSNAFAGKDIKAVSLSNFIEEIPDGAFKNCNSLEAILCPGVNKIGSRAFQGCTKLGEFTIPLSVDSLGSYAFDGIERLSVEASCKEVAFGAINSGAKEIILNISANPASMSNAEFTVPTSVDYFELRGNTASFENIHLVSDSKSTVLNGLNITCTNGIPLKISSESITFNRMTINSSGYSALITNDNADISLYGSIKINSNNGKAIVCRNINLDQIDSSISSLLTVSGNIYICGDISGNKYLKVENGSIIPISEAEYENYIKGSYEVSFDPNGGTVDTTTKTVYYGETYGELPTPTRSNCEFLGWYLNDTKITSDMVLSVAEDVTLKARWQSGWVLAGSIPEDGEKNGDWWTYDYTSHQTTPTNTSPGDGWTKEKDRTWVWGEYGSWSNWSTNSVSGSDSREVKSKNVLDGWYAYTWYKIGTRYYYNYDPGNGATCQEWGFFSVDAWNNGTQISPGGKSSGQYAGTNSGNITGYNLVNGVISFKGSEVNHTEWSYRDRSKIYTYYWCKVESLDSETEIIAGGDISNVKHWVKYIVK